MALLGGVSGGGFGAGAFSRLKAAPPVPPLCLFSQILSRITYTDLGDIVKQIGFDGIDLTIRPGGHVEPRLSSVDLVRAFESVMGAGLECPLITTALTSPMDPGALPVLAISGRTSIPLFRTGDWMPENSNYRRDIAGLVSIGSHYGIAMALHNYTSENAGEAPWDVARTLALFDPKWAGAFFDPIHGRAHWEDALRPLLPRLKAVAVKDFQLVKSGGEGKAVPCPLGEGVVDWPRFFGMLAQAGFAGPLSVRVEYAPKDELAAITKDYEFARKQMNAAYVRMGSGSGAGSGSGPG